ncbi:MAG TPA: ATP-binding protein [Marinilabiliales bacterium]|nr:MAG: hypothetical protein A2W84_07985 [Bacteroidetes bacterium GWC2_40_13]OFX75760.1 MAG: hypothetical protein A2W96_09345 [Bacteroidetes bacterium GWD2_40_43]OFX94967.1 MAG: hypothetical protein A2W97_16495 [Bacteroidetes bacterium GWE2_40_63]OFY23479.1 MAG: hypothetical protein A2W88_08310 [Bacteroidetes bacterium GWF2_40_13]OFZ29395.1 MAG: hypothetical protein A2437_09290 [Bacteroidetes bacterium RIFOXYC2_FULL_40_12]HAM98633.1 ATP-binding protein [Marinilabiliales bacterium]
MDPISLTILTYVSLKFLDQFLKEEGYGRIKKWLFPIRKYSNQLAIVISKTIQEYEKDHPFKSEGNKFPFYHSQILFEELNKYILFKTVYSNQQLLLKFKENSNIILPSTKELNEFYDRLVTNINNDKLLKVLFIEENYKSKIFDIHESIINIENKISSLNEQVVFNPNNEWFQRQCEASILDLGNRYTPELNFKLEVSDIFEGIGRTKKFQKSFTEKIDSLLISGKKVLKDIPQIKEHILLLEKFFDDILELYNKTTFSGIQALPSKEFQELIEDAKKTTEIIQEFYQDEERKIQKEKNDYQFYHKYGYEIKNLREFDNRLSKFGHFINGNSVKLANNPYLVLDGEAGIGKSHMLGDVISVRTQFNYQSIFLLGQHFVSEEDPWTQIFKRLQINSKSNDFLQKLNEFGKTSNKRVLIIIDAINEGKGKKCWPNFINSFIKEIKSYEWLGLVLSIRTSYKNLIFPKDQIETMGVIEQTLYGFRSVEYEASKLFFDNYNIEQPNIPLLHPEFQNPLFLKLFCDSLNKSGLTRIPDGLQGISSIINFFINSINLKLANPNRLDYSERINLVKKSVESIILFKVENKARYVPYEKAYEIVEDEVSKFINTKGFLDELIREGIFSLNLFWNPDKKPEDGIYLAYERFEDHLMAQYLIEKYPKLEEEFGAEGQLHDYIKDERAININRGLIDAFSIQIPEVTGKDFFNFVPTYKDNYTIIESFVESLLWRKIETITDESRDYVNEYVFLYQGTHDFFWETILAITAIPNHYFNAYSLHNHLMKFSLSDRDAGWTQSLKYKYSDESTVKRLIDWAWSNNDKSHISDESIKLSCIALAWFHTTTNRQLRDCSTKALVSLLQTRVHIIIELLELFEGVNDPYVYERLYAVAYGCAVRTNQIEELTKLSEYIFNSVFNKEKVYPHILLRDYARGVIEYAHYKKCTLDFDLAKIRPPYKSQWPEIIPSEKELKDRYDNSKYRQIWSSVMGFGDFSRYTIGTNHNLSEWSGYQKNQTPIDREKLFDDFKSHLSSKQQKLLDQLDPIISEESDEEFDFGDSKIRFNVAVGRKSEEELNKIRADFKKSLSQEKLKYYEEEVEPYLDHNHNIINTGFHFDLRITQRLIFSRVISLGWNPEIHGNFDDEIGTGRGRSTYPHERIGKKYQWIAYYEYLAMLSDNFIKYERWGSDKQQEAPYQGPWEPYVRDIDPTMLIHKTGSYESDDPEKFWWSDRNKFDWQCSNDDWVNNSNVLPKFEDLMQVKDSNNEEWLILEGFPSWSEPKKIGEEKWDYPHKELWCHIRSYFVKENDFESFKNWAVKQDFMGRWMPESTDRYEVFSREYYWSPAHNYFMSEYYGGEEWRDIHDNETGVFIASVMIPTEGFLWEEEFDKSKEETISFLKPCRNIFEGMNLQYSDQEGAFIDNTGEIICFATNVYHNSKSHLIVKKEPFIKYLKKNGLNILWTVLGEKQVIGGRTFENEYSGRLEMSGAFYLDNNKFYGKINTKNS